MGALIQQNFTMENYYSKIVFGENDADSSEQNINEQSEDGVTVESGMFSQVVDQYFKDHQATDVSTVSGDESQTIQTDSIPAVNLDHFVDSNIHPVNYLFNWIAAAPFSDVSEEQNMACGPVGATTQPQEDAT